MKQRLSNPKNHPNYKNGISLSIKYCVDCGIPLNGYRAMRCLKCETLRRIKSRIWCKPKNIPETKLEFLLQQILPNEYKYVGDGTFLIEYFNPDFINCNGQKKIIEMFGDYWHTIPKVKKRDYIKFGVYKKYGYKTLVVWEKELQNLPLLQEKILNFNKN
jgi:hypothetical protein